MMKNFLEPICCAVLLVFVVLAGEAGATEQGVWREAEFEGQKVAYLEAGPPEAPALVFIHGWSCDASFWRFQTPEFAKSYHVIAVDLPGFGKSGKPHNVTYSMDFFARAVQAVIEDAKVKSPVLVGHSMAYAVIRHYMTLFPGNARAVVTVDGVYFRIPATAEERAAMEEGGKAMMAAFEGPDHTAAVTQFLESTFYGKTPEALRPGILASMLAVDAYVANSAMGEFIKLDQWADMTFDVPALAIYPSAGNLAADNESYLRTVFPQLTYTLWDDTGHYMMLEQPERFNAELANFLKTLPL